MKAACYTRVSTAQQNADMQIPDIERFAAAHGWEITGRYSDTMSGAKDNRPALKRLMADATKRKFDVVLVWALDRFGRSVPQMVANIQELDRLGIRFIAVTQGIDTDRRSPAAELILNVLASIASFERSMIRERVRGGIARFREDYAAGKIGNGVQTRSKKNLGIGRPRAVFRIDLATSLRESGASWREIAMELRMPESTLRERMKEVGVWNG